MRLKISNFSRIGQADILVDGITVIAGENNTGKSTVGKILFCLFNSLSNIEERILEQRIKEVQDTFMTNSRNYFSDKYRRVPIRTWECARRIAASFREQLEQGAVSQDVIHQILREAIPINSLEKVDTANFDEFLTDMTGKIDSILHLPGEAITLEVLTRYFNRVFYEQINSLIDTKTEAEVALRVKDRTIRLGFSDNACTACDAGLALMHQAVYIDNPFVVDAFSTYDDLNVTNDYLRDLLTEEREGDVMQGVIGSMLAKEKLGEVLGALGTVVNGAVMESNDKFYLSAEGYAQPLLLNNLSTGLKSFVILKMLLERGALREKDVLILDEPEIHLHPQWQIVYAELIVLLQKHFDLTVVVTTHSPYFLDAVNLFSIKHGVGDKTNFYLSSIEDNRVKMERVTGEVDRIYQKMASPLQVLDTLRYELNEK